MLNSVIAVGTLYVCFMATSFAFAGRSPFKREKFENNLILDLSSADRTKEGFYREHNGQV